MKIKYSASFSMGVHALTLSILNMVYIIINGFTGWTVKIFQFMYTAISYIYIVTAILMIKTDYMKRQAEVEKIKSVLGTSKKKKKKKKRRKRKTKKLRLKTNVKEKDKKKKRKSKKNKKIQKLKINQKEAMYKNWFGGYKIERQ